jgi:hypothetical protein
MDELGRFLTLLRRKALQRRLRGQQVFGYRDIVLEHPVKQDDVQATELGVSFDSLKRDIPRMRDELERELFYLHAAVAEAPAVQNHPLLSLRKGGANLFNALLERG